MFLFYFLIAELSKKYSNEKSSSGTSRYSIPGGTSAAAGLSSLSNSSNISNSSNESNPLLGTSSIQNSRALSLQNNRSTSHKQRGIFINLSIN